MMKKLSAISNQHSAGKRRFSLSRRAAFTLTELMVAVVVLLVVIIATSKIFGTASKITGMGNAVASVMQEAAAIEQQFRKDIARVTSEGFFVLHSVGVPNNYYTGSLLNPNLAPTAIIRADQLVFFANGVESVQGYHVSSGQNHRGQGTAARIYWGHGFQLPEGLGVFPDSTEPNRGSGHDPNLLVTSVPPLTPWYRGVVPMTRVLYGVIASSSSTGTDIFGPGSGSAPSVNGNQPESRQWTLARQNVTLLDDDTTAGNANSKTVFLGEVTTARSIWFNATNLVPWGWSRELRNGRMDAAATQLDTIRRWVIIQNPLTGALRPWSNPGGAVLSEQRGLIKSAVYYPRTERKAPSMHRIDQALTDHTIGSACSSFTIDWTYDHGVGEVLDQLGNVVDPDGIPNNGDELFGVGIDSTREHPWFGLTDVDRGVGNYADPEFRNAARFRWAQMIYHSWPAPANGNIGNIEDSFTIGGIRHYWATFGYNQHAPLNGNGVPDAALGYTPFPTAIRVTMTLHDPEGRMENGREFQFVIDLPDYGH